jgi:hypothetical protein
VSGEHPSNHELEHWLAGLDEPANGVVTALYSQVARVEPIGRYRDEGLGRESLLFGKGSARRFLTGLVGVEGEDDFTGSG